MNVLYHAIFYTLAAIILLSTLMAITRRNTVHAVVYLVFSFFGTAVLFYLLGAPLLAALEVIIYAGAIMVLFLFIIMTMRTEEPVTRAGEEPPVATTRTPRLPHTDRQPLLTPHSSLHSLSSSASMGLTEHPGCDLPDGWRGDDSPFSAGRHATHAGNGFPGGLWYPSSSRSYWLPLEIVSFLLFVALVGALYLGKREQQGCCPRATRMNSDVPLW